MARIGIAIVKATSFRNGVQEFTNVYHYTDGVGANPSEATALGLIDEVTANEKTFHANTVSFLRGKCWSVGGTKAENVMLAQKLLTGVGSLVPDVNMDKERAYLVLWAAGQDSRGKKVNLKKWYHSCGIVAGANVGNWSAKLQNTGGFNASERAATATEFDRVTNIGNLEGWSLCAESGRQRDGGVPKAHEFLEHHQLGDMWR